MTTSIYVFNKYYTLYHNIISLAISKNRYKSKEHYYENHHIHPDAFGGTEDPQNMVLLTLREHYLCHYLLTKFTLNDYKRKMCFAFHLMNHVGRYVLDSKLYESNKILRTKLGVSEETKQKISKTKSGVKNSKTHCLNISNGMIGHVVSEESKCKMSLSALGKSKSDTHKKNIGLSKQGINNYRFVGYFITPYGSFESPRMASTNELSHSTIRRWCNNPDNILTRNYKYFTSRNINPIGKTFRELGFYIIASR